jgi:hypothetical protein
MPKPEPTEQPLCDRTETARKKARGLSGAGADSSENGPPSYEIGSSEAPDPMKKLARFRVLGRLRTVISHIYRVPIETIDGILRKRRVQFLG